MYTHLLEKYANNETDDSIEFKIVSELQQYNISPGERWVLYDLILLLPKYSDLKLSDWNIEELVFTCIKEYKFSNNTSVNTCIYNLCKSLKVSCKLPRPDRHKFKNYNVK